jgi:hypothetical protein
MRTPSSLIPSLVALAAVSAVVACSSTATTTDAGTTTTTPSSTATATSTTAPDTGAPPADASASAPDTAVPLPPPASFDITSGTCVDTPSCGGVLDGTWDYSAACVPTNALSGLASACPTASFTKLAGKMAGRLTVQGNVIERKATLAVNADVTVPASCAQAVGGCAGVSAVLRSGPGVKSANCTGAGSCDCTLEADLVLDKSGTTFTTNGNTLTTSDGDEYSYCVTGGKLTHKQTKSGTPNKSEIGNYEATKR